MVGKSQQPGLAVGGHFEFIIEKQGAEKAGVFFLHGPDLNPKEGRHPLVGSIFLTQVT